MKIKRNHLFILTLLIQYSTYTLNVLCKSKGFAYMVKCGCYTLNSQQAVGAVVNHNNLKLKMGKITYTLL